MIENVYSDDDILQKIRENPHLSTTEWKEKGLNPTVNTVQRRFGGWNKAREEAGVKTGKEGRKKVRGERILDIVRENGPMKRQEIMEELGKEYINLNHYDIKYICMSVSKSHGSTKYGMSKLIDLSFGEKVIYLDPMKLAKFLKKHIRFDLNKNLEHGKKLALTHFLMDWMNDGLPEKTADWLRSEYKKDWNMD